MNKHRRINNLLAAGSLVGLLVLTFLAFNQNIIPNVFAAQNTEGIPANGVSANSLPANNVLGTGAMNGTEVLIDQQSLTMLQDQNSLLRQTVQALEARDDEYRTAVETANQTILRLEAAATAAQTTEMATRAAATGETEVLQQSVQTLQSREGEFRTQLELANTTIRRLEGELQQQGTAAQTLQQQNGELTRVVQLLQGREVEYQAQLQAANAALQTQANSSGGSGGGYTNHEEHEEHDD